MHGVDRWLPRMWAQSGRHILLERGDCMPVIWDALRSALTRAGSTIFRFRVSVYCGRTQRDAL